VQQIFSLLIPEDDQEIFSNIAGKTFLAQKRAWFQKIMKLAPNCPMNEAASDFSTQHRT
jgi:hypothetical protein